MKYIEDQWNSYRAMCVPKDASEVQVKETKQAFYAGASILFTFLMQTLDGGTEETAADLQKMADLQAEIDAFGHSMDKKYVTQQ